MAKKTRRCHSPPERPPPLYAPSIKAWALTTLVEGPLNAGEEDKFAKCFRVLFKDTPSYKKKSDDQNARIAELQLELLRNGYWKAVAHDPKFVKKCKTFNAYAWETLQQVRKMDPNGRNTIHIKVARDYRTYMTDKSEED